MPIIMLRLTFLAPRVFVAAGQQFTKGQLKEKIDNDEYETVFKPKTPTIKQNKMNWDH